MNIQTEFDAILRVDFCSFVQKVFQTVSAEDVYSHNWHIEAISYELMRVHNGESTRLIITQPPRSLKSICTSVAYVAWALGHDPAMRFMVVSYSNELAVTLAKQFRAVVASEWYQRVFPRVRIIKDTETEVQTSELGGRVAISVGGSLTGRGADIIIIDDPMKADDAQSEAARRTLNDWYSSTLISRLNDKQKGPIILVMQRLHEDDLAGNLLAGGEWCHLNLPARAIEDQCIPIGKDRYFLRKAGDALHEAREPLPTLARLENELGSRNFAAQYQQQPVPAEGNLIKAKWPIYYCELPRVMPGSKIVQSWDVATTTGANSDYSVCTTWYVFKRNFCLIDLWREKVEFPTLRKKVVELAQRHKANVILIEKAGPGIELIQELKNNHTNGVPLPLGNRPDGDKFVRMAAQAIRFESGQVFIPEEAPWLADFLNELLGFPNTRNDDQVDSVSQFLKWAEKDAYIGEPQIPIGPKIIG